MRKSLIIGVGGTGASVIKRVTELIEWRNNLDTRKVPNVKFLELDTDPSSMPPGNDFIHMTVSQEDINELRKKHAEGNYTWFDPSSIQAKFDGAGGVRMQGKLAFWKNCENFKTNVAAKLQNLEMLQQTEFSKIFPKSTLVGITKVFVVANSVSGTGSGSFVDVGYAIKSILKARMKFANMINVTLILTLPANADDHAKMANSYYALQELNHYMADNSYHIDDFRYPGQKIEFEQGEWPYDNVYLISPRTGGNIGNAMGAGIFSNSQLEDIIGEYIYTDVFSPAAEVRDGRRSDMETYFRKKDGLGYCTNYLTFGMATMEYPLIQISKCCTYRFLVEAINMWYNMGGVRSNGNIPEWASEKYRPQKADEAPINMKELKLGNGDFKDDGSLQKALVDITTYYTFGGREISNVEIIKKINDIKTTYLNNCEIGKDVSELSQLEQQLESGFETLPSGITESDESFSRGIVDRVILSNRQKLLAEIPQQIKERIVKTIFSSKAGPLVAITQLKDIINLMEQYSVCNAKSIPSVIKEDLKNLRSEMDFIESDVLLKFGGFDRLPFKRLLKEYEENLEVYINSMFECKLVAARAELAKEIKPILETLMQRVKNFNTYVVEGWRNRLINNYLDTVKPISINGYDVTEGRIEEEVDTNYIDIVGKDLSEKRLSKFNAFINNLYEFKGELERELNTEGIFDSVLCDVENHPAEDKILHEERKTFIEALGRHSVIDRFFIKKRTEQERISVIQEVNSKARLFIDAKESDNYTILDPGKMFKKWYFYPGGDQINSVADATSNNPTAKFAQLLNSSLTVTNWGHESKDSYNNQTILFLEERGSFPLRFVNLLPMMRESIKRLNNNIDSFIARRDVYLTPLDIDRQKELKESKVIFLVSVGLGVLELRGEDKFQLSGAKGIGKKIAGVNILLSRTNKEATYQLYNNKKWQMTLEAEIAKYLNNSGEQDCVEKLHDLLENPTRFGLVVSSNVNDKDRIEIENLVLYEFIRHKDKLRIAWDSTYPDEAVSSRSIIQAEYKTNEPGYPQPGFYCAVCDSFLGNYCDAYGNPNELMLPESCTNPLCGIV